MPRNPLDTVRRLRQQSVDANRARLTESLAAASEAAAAVRAAGEAIAVEMDAASDLSGDDARVESFAAWLPGARQRAIQAQAQQDRQEAEVARRRADLTISKTALESVETLIGERQAAQNDAEQRREQQELDDIAATRRPDEV